MRNSTSEKSSASLHEPQPHPAAHHGVLRRTFLALLQSSGAAAALASCTSTETTPPATSSPALPSLKQGELIYASATTLAKAIRTKQVSSEEVVKAYVDRIEAVNPKLIYCSITGFGQDGPYAQRAGYDFMIQGMAGSMSITGEPDGPPMKSGVAYADIFTGLHAVIGITAALFHRERTGEGQYLDLALLDSQVAVLANQASNYLVGGTVPGRLGNAHPNIVPYQTFETADGHIIIAVGTDRQFKEYCSIIGVAELANDERFNSKRKRVENRTDLAPLLARPMKARTTAAWVAALDCHTTEQSPAPSFPPRPEPRHRARFLQ